MTPKKFLACLVLCGVAFAVIALLAYSVYLFGWVAVGVIAGLLTAVTVSDLVQDCDDAVVAVILLGGLTGAAVFVSFQFFAGRLAIACVAISLAAGASVWWAVSVIREQSEEKVETPEWAELP